MPTKRQIKFMAQVVNAARSKPIKARGRPILANLTDEGRAKGMEAMRRAPRCQAKRRDGEPCQAVALRGAKRCLKHGGRVEVPEHPHNIRRFLSGELRRQHEWKKEREAWESMSLHQQREFAASLPQEIADSERLVIRAARIWREVQDGGYRAWAKMVSELLRV